MQSLDTSRIDYLLDRSDTASIAVALIGAGSGGAAVMQTLAMCGIRRWNLFDPDVLEPANLVKHPALRRDLGRLKVDVMKEWLLDRNPTAEIETHAENIFSSPTFESSLAMADIVICAVDNRAARRYVNDACVRARRPCVTGSVMRTGLGGEIYLYLPGTTGCFSCLETYCDVNERNLEDLVPVTGEEAAHRYGMNEKNFATSGLATNISVVASLHASMILAAAMGGGSEFLPAPRFNWLLVGLRELPGVFDAPFSVSRLLLAPRRDCRLRCTSAVGPSFSEGK